MNTQIHSQPLFLNLCQNAVIYLYQLECTPNLLDELITFSKASYVFVQLGQYGMMAEISFTLSNTDAALLNHCK